MVLITDVINHIGFGPAQVYTAILANGVWMADGIEFAMVPVLMSSIASDLSLSDAQKASSAAVVFAGIGVGSILGGYFGDHFGRRRST